MSIILLFGASHNKSLLPRRARVNTIGERNTLAKPDSSCGAFMHERSRYREPAIRIFVTSMNISFITNQRTNSGNSAIFGNFIRISINERFIELPPRTGDLRRRPGIPRCRERSLLQLPGTTCIWIDIFSWSSQWVRDSSGRRDIGRSPCHRDGEVGDSRRKMGGDVYLARSLRSLLRI